MKETEILKIDSRGRIVIPRSMRKSLNLKENSQIMLISDPDDNELRIIPLPFSDEQTFIKFKMIIPDEPGALSKISHVFGKVGASIIHGQTITLKKNQIAEFSVVSQVPEMPIEEFKVLLREKGGAHDITVERPVRNKVTLNNNE